MTIVKTDLPSKTNDVQVEGTPRDLIFEAGLALYGMYAALRDVDQAAGRALREYIMLMAHSEDFWRGKIIGADLICPPNRQKGVMRQ